MLCLGCCYGVSHSLYSNHRLDERFRLTREVGLLKAEHKLDPVDKTREVEKLAKLRSLCDKKTLNPDFIEELFSSIMEEVVKNHQSIDR